MAGMGSDLFIAGAATSLIGTIAGVFSNIENINQRKEIDKENAEQYRYDAQLAVQNASAKYILLHNEFNQKMSHVKTSAIESGVRPNSYGNLVNEAAFNAGLDQYNTLQSGQEQSYYYKTAAAQADYDYKMTEAYGPFTVASGILQGGAQGLNAYSLFYKPRQTVNQDFLSRNQREGIGGF